MQIHSSANANKDANVEMGWGYQQITNSEPSRLESLKTVEEDTHQGVDCNKARSAAFGCLWPAIVHSEYH
jgi:hypothetical protein